MPRHAARVIVDAQEVDRLGDQPQVGVGEGRPRGTEDLGQLRRVGAAQHRFQVLAVHVGVRAARRRDVGRRVAGGALRLDVEDDADAAPPPALGPVGLHGRPVRPEQVVRDPGGGLRCAVAGRQRAVHIAAVHHHPRLIESRPQRNTVVERAEQDAGVVGEPVGAVGIEPAAQVVQGGRHVPVIQGERRLNPALEQRVDQPVVEAETARVDRSPPDRQNPAPGDTEAVGVEAEVVEQRHVVPEAVIMVAGDVPRFAVRGAARGVGEAMPDARPGAVGERRAFDLVGRGCRPPEEVVGKLTHSSGRCPWPA